MPTSVVAVGAFDTPPCNVLRRLVVLAAGFALLIPMPQQFENEIHQHYRHTNAYRNMLYPPLDQIIRATEPRQKYPRLHR